MLPALASVNTVVYGQGRLDDGGFMPADQLSAKDWLRQGLKTLARSGFTALKAEPLAKAMGVSRGSFYWHFADVDAYHAALLKYWREVSAERIIADLEAAPDGAALPQLFRRAFHAKPPAETAIRSWAAHNPAVRKAVDAIDTRRMSYIASVLMKSGLPDRTARARARVLYWTFVGFVLMEKPLRQPQQEAVIDELIRFAQAKE